MNKTPHFKHAPRIPLLVLFAMLAIASSASTAAATSGGLPPAFGTPCGHASGASWQFHGQTGTQYNVAGLPRAVCAIALKSVGCARRSDTRRPERLPLRQLRHQSGSCGILREWREALPLGASSQVSSTGPRASVTEMLPIPDELAAHKRRRTEPPRERGSTYLSVERDLRASIETTHRTTAAHPAELRAGVDLGLCSPAMARTLIDRGFVRDDLALAAFEERPSFSPQHTNPGWIWYVLHSRWLFETGLTANETLDAVSALNVDFGHPQASECHPSGGSLLLPPIRFPRIVEVWARALADEFDSRPPI